MEIASHGGLRGYSAGGKKEKNPPSSAKLHQVYLDVKPGIREAIPLNFPPHFFTSSIGIEILPVSTPSSPF